MAIEDIERLKEKLEKDPNSKLFVPLAEEYKKAGMLDEAIEVLVKGLENQPGYLSARVSLGKIFIDRGMLHEAQSEFEKVIASIPDNLYAHKKLAEIYTDLGEREKAVREFKTVLKLNPLDEWAATSLSEIDKQHEEITEQPVMQVIEPTSYIEPEPVSSSPGEPLFELPDEDLTPSYTEEAEPVTAATEIGSPADAEEIQSLQPAGEIPDIDMDEIVLPAEEPAKPWTPSETVEELSEEEMHEPFISPEDMEIWKSHTESLQPGHEAASAGNASDIWKPLYDSELEHGTANDIPVPAAGPEIAEEPAHVETVLQEEPHKAVENPVAPKDISPETEKAPDLSDADVYINDGKYFSAMNIYRKIIEKDPANIQVMQRVEELKALLKLLGKDKEELVSKLDSFLDAIKKRQDELRGSS